MSRIEISNALLAVAFMAGQVFTCTANAQSFAPAKPGRTEGDGGSLTKTNKAAVPNAGSISQDEMRPYRIGGGDILGIEVWKEPEASAPAVAVRPDGSVSLPIIGEVRAAGLTPHELEEALKTRYAQYLRVAGVVVTVKEIHSQKVYVIGEVKKEGPLRLEGPMTVLQALAEVGGVTDYANSKKIYVLRTDGGEKKILHFDYKAVLHGQKMDGNIMLAPGDTIVVPR